MRIAINVLLLLWFHPALAESGIASVYANGDGHEWTKTSNGERVDPNAFTAAHKTLPFGTIVLVTNENTGRKVFVRITDRGPFKSGRVIDLTPAAADKIKLDGLAPVTLSVATVTPSQFSLTWLMSGLWLTRSRERSLKPERKPAPPAKIAGASTPANP